MCSTNSTGSHTNSSEDDLEVVPAGIPKDKNVGQAAHFLDTICSTLEQKPIRPLTDKRSLNPSAKPVMKRSASSELLKIENLDNYMEACAEYRRGLRAEAQKDHLWGIIAKWRALDVKVERS
ncbi:hypothetical protein EJ07DRAFT_151944 [Lizonia empirigonia]|nr:hypothetical protein EJ07DRAFT_151944 [Lizonia empirigonia]